MTCLDSASIEKKLLILLSNYTSNQDQEALTKLACNAHILPSVHVLLLIHCLVDLIFHLVNCKHTSQIASNDIAFRLACDEHEQGCIITADVCEHGKWEMLFETKMLPGREDCMLSDLLKNVQALYLEQVRAGRAMD
jgi:hypothetical protein